MLKKIIPAAEDQGVVLALENHIDLTADEMVDLITTLNSPWLGVCLDTGNSLRLVRDPLVVAAKLAPLTRATHVPRTSRCATRRAQGVRLLAERAAGIGIGGHSRRGESLAQGALPHGLLAIEVDFLDPDYGEEDRAVTDSVKYLEGGAG